MNKLGKILFFAVPLIFTVHLCFAQAGSIKVDSARMIQKKPESATNTKGQNSDGLNKQQGKNPNSDGTKAVKQVRGARPDMSKARGARPPNIVRPSGSGIPRGLGKPGGAGRHGGR